MSLAYLIGGVELTQRFGASGQDVGSSVGTASFTLLNDDPQNSLCDYGVKVEVRLDNADGALRPGMPVEVRLTPPAAQP